MRRPARALLVLHRLRRFAPAIAVLACCTVATPAAAPAAAHRASAAPLFHVEIGIGNQPNHGNGNGNQGQSPAGVGSTTPEQPQAGAGSGRNGAGGERGRGGSETTPTPPSSAPTESVGTGAAPAGSEPSAATSTQTQSTPQSSEVGGTHGRGGGHEHGARDHGVGGRGGSGSHGVGVSSRGASSGSRGIGSHGTGSNGSGAGGVGSESGGVGSESRGTGSEARGAGSGSRGAGSESHGPGGAGSHSSTSTSGRSKSVAVTVEGKVTGLARVGLGSHRSTGSGTEGGGASEGAESEEASNGKSAGGANETSANTGVADGNPVQAVPSPTVTSATPVVASSLAGVPASSPLTASSPSPLFVTSVAQPTVAVGEHRARRASTRTRARSGPIQVPPAAAIAAAPFATVSSVSPAPPAESHRRRSAGNTRPAPPLVTTITRIVGVVPTPIRLLLAALIALALAFGVRSRLIARRARRLERQRAELMEDVGLLQAALLPVTPSRMGLVETSTAYRPADGPAAGGDFYDVFALEDGQLAVILGDVSGHGRQALPHTALVRFTLRAYLEAGFGPRLTLQTAGTVLERQLGGSFATVVVATYNPRERVLTYSCAGHPPPLVLGSRPVEPVTASAAPPVGVGIRTGTRQSAVSLPGGAKVCFHTDGLTEARVEGELFGSDRLASALQALQDGARAEDLLERVAEETDVRPDDMAACLLRVDGGGAAPVSLSEELEVDGDEAMGERAERFLRACGVEGGAAAEAMRAAHAAAGHSGTVVLEVTRPDGVPQVHLRRENVAHLHPPRSLQPIRLGVSL